MLSASGPHRFGRPRLSAETLTLSIANSAAFSSRPFQPLPPPPGKEPFRLEIADILPAGHLAAITVSRKLVFHIGGDAGGIKDAVPQQLVANGMERDFPGDATHPENDPAFFYMLGDCVYFNGQATEYFAPVLPALRALPRSNLRRAGQPRRRRCGARDLARRLRPQLLRDGPGHDHAGSGGEHPDGHDPAERLLDAPNAARHDHRSLHQRPGRGRHSSRSAELARLRDDGGAEGLAALPYHASPGALG